MNKTKSPRPEVLNASAWLNGYHIDLPSVKSSPIRPQACRIVNGIDSHPAEDFLINSRFKDKDIEIKHSIAPFLADSGLLALSVRDRKKGQLRQTIPLPKTKGLRMALHEALLRRKSVRSFSEDPIGIAELADLLWAGYGRTGTNHFKMSCGTQISLDRRSIASAGGLYPINIYVFNFKINGLNRSLYKFIPNINSLQSRSTVISPEDVRSEMFSNNSFINEASALIVLAGVPWKSIKKYGSRGLRFMFHEAGSISQNIDLAAACLGVGTLNYASLTDSSMHKLLQIDGIRECFVHCLLVGFPACERI